MPVLEFTKKDRKNKIVKCGSMEIKNITEESADMYFFGDICSESWQSEWYEEDKCPKDVDELLKSIESTKALNIHINSGGGSVCGGVAIYNILKRHKGYKTVYVEGLAASIASLIAMVGDKIIIPSNAMLMIHKPWSYCSGNADNLRKEADVLDIHQKTILNTYMSKTKEGITEEQIDKMINDETWLSGEDAAKYFDIEVSEANEAAACDSFYFDKYKNIPDNLMKQDTQDITNVDTIVNEVVKQIKDILKHEDETDHTDQEEIEKRKAAILADLDLI